MQVLTCSLEDRDGSPSWFRYNNFENHVPYGLLLHLRLNDRWSVASGWYRGGAGWSYKFKNPPGVHQRHARGGELDHYPLLGYYDLKQFRWGRLYRRPERISDLTYDNDDIFYLFLFRVQAFAGISYDHLVADGDDNKTEFINFGNLTHNVTNTVVTRRGASLWLGTALQFRHQGKDRLQLRLYYVQGLRKLVNIDLEYDWEGQTYRPQLGVRGSAFGIDVSYPIRLARFYRDGRPR
ncbi:hypothetical protein [Catalinimonas alkaloidigena]|nr:hypothetical protein [Catalinimonas alkaloidigena]